MKPSKLVLILVTFLIFQTVNAQVGFSVGPLVGLTVPSGDYGGTTIDYYNGVKYGLLSGVNFGVLFKAKLPVVRIRAGISYVSLSNTGNSETDKPNSFVEVKHNLFMVSIGPEFGFNIPASPVVPYAGLDILFTSIGGESKFQGVARVNSGNSATYSLNSASRIGIGLGAGAEFHFGKKYGLDIGIRYNLVNLLGKKFEELPSDKRED